MKQHLRDQVDWEQPFTPEEYKRRVNAVRDSLSRQGIDAIYVHQGGNLTYLTNYDMVWYNLRTLIGLLIRADTEGVVFFDTRQHTTMVSTTPEISEIVWFEPGFQSNPIDTIIRSIKDRGLGNGNIALEKMGFSPHATVMNELESRLQEGGATVVDGSTIVEDISNIKSPAEIEVVRKAAAIGDKAMAAARDCIRPGITEQQIEGVVMGSMMADGGGYPAIRTMLGSGPRTGTHHSPPTLRRVKQGDLVFIDFCGVYHRYHVNVNRTFSLGDPDPRWTDLMDKSAACVDAIVEALKPGDPLAKVDEVANKNIESAGLKKYAWFIGGYSTGISVPPDWVGRLRYAPLPGEEAKPFVPGMVLNFENQFDVFNEVWPGGSGACYIETLLMTDSGIEVLSKLPRNLVVV